MTTIFDEYLNKSQNGNPQHNTGNGRLDVERYLSDHGVGIIKVDQRPTGTLYCLEHCIFDPNHTPNEAAIGQTTEGKLTYQCFHESCKDKNWHDAKRAISGEISLANWMIGGNGNGKPNSAFIAKNNEKTISPQEPNPGKSIIDPFTPEFTRIGLFLSKPPPEPRHLIRYHGEAFVNRRTVGSLAAAGGTGKTSFLLQAISAWAAGNDYAGFVPICPLNILGLFAEEEQEEIERKLWVVNGGRFPVGLHARSIKGILGPLMKQDNGSPVRTKWWDWLDQTISNHFPLDLLVLDPKSRLYGLIENDNDHNTQWVACLEALAVKHDLSVLFTHHVSKNIKEISQWMARGGGALVDACRVNFGMIGLVAEEGKKYGIEEWWNYIRLKISKINIGPKGGHDAFLKFDENGLLQPVNVHKERIKTMKTHFLFLLSQEKRGFSRRDLTKQAEGKHISDKMKTKFTDFTRSRDVDMILDALLEEGLIYEGHEQTATKGKVVFYVR